MKLNALKLALTAAILSAISMALLPVIGIYFGRGLRVISLLGRAFPGYTNSWQGAGLGLVYGFITCFVYGGIFALIYNTLPEYKVKNIKAKPAGKKKKK